MEATMRRILIGEAANEVRQRLWKLIEANRRLVVEVSKSADDRLILVVYLRLPGAPWWEISRFTIEIEDGVAILRDNIPIRAAIAALNAAVGRQVVKARRFGALCPQCGTAHEEWVSSPVGDHCVFCGWVVGTKPLGRAAQLLLEVPPPLADAGWRVEVLGRGKYWQWRRGHGRNRKARYGGRFETLPPERQAAYFENVQKRVARSRDGAGDLPEHCAGGATSGVDIARNEWPNQHPEESA
jgi:hypothetical protein